VGLEAGALGRLIAPLLAPPAPWALSLGLPLAAGILALLLRWVRPSAFFIGVPFGALVLRFGGLGGFLVLLGFFLLGTALTRLGYSSKEAKGVAEEAGGRRGGSHVLANCGVGFLILILRAVLDRDGTGGGEALLWAGYVGSFAAAASDTASSEIGQLWGRRTISLRSFREVPVGTEGAVSLEGLLAGLAASAILGLLGLGLGLLSGIAFVAVTAGGFLGNFLESLAGTWGRRRLPHGWLNFVNSLVGAGAAALLLAIC
jgi:uncharacterized protein (TIGR00297 family)